MLALSLSDKFCCFGILLFNRFLFSRFSFHHFFVLVLVFVNAFVIFSFFTIFVFVNEKSHWCVLHLCIQCTWSSVLAVDDVMYNRFSSACAVWNILEKTSLGVPESPGIFPKQEGEAVFIFAYIGRLHFFGLVFRSVQNLDCVQS